MGSALNAREVAIVLQARNELNKGLAQANRELQSFYGKAEKSTSVPGGAAASWQKYGGAVVGIGGPLAIAAAGGMMLKREIQALQDTISEGAAFKDMAQMTGASAEALSQYEYIARMTGATLGDVTTAWRFMSKNLSDMGVEGQAAQKALSDLGLSAADLRGMNVDKAFEAILDQINALPSAFDRTKAAMSIFGRGGSEVLKMAKDHAQLRREAESLSTVTTAMAERFDEADDAMTRVQFASKQLRREIAGVLSPAVSDSSNHFSDWLTDIANGIRTLAGEARDARGELDRMMAGEGGWGTGHQQESESRMTGFGIAQSRAALADLKKFYPDPVTAALTAKALKTVTDEAKRLGVAVSEWRFENGEAGLFPRDQSDILKDINTELNKAAATVKAIAAVGPMGWGFDKGVENFGPDKFAMGDVGYQPAGKWYEGQDERTKANLQSMHEYVESLQEVNRLSEEALRLDREHADELRRMKTEAIDGIYTGMSSIFDLVNEGNSDWARGLQKIYGWYRAIEAISRAIGLMKMILGPAAGSGGSLVGTSPAPIGNPGIVAMDSWTGAPAPSLAGAASQGQTVVYAPVTVAPGSLLVADDSMSIARLGDKLARHIETKVNNTFRDRQEV